MADKKTPRPDQGETPDRETYLTLHDVAVILRCRTSQIAELARRRTPERSDNPLPVFKLSSKMKRVRKSDLHAWLERLIKDLRPP